ncbi:hypothetical protein [Desulfolithobacter sp.]
MKIKKIIMIGLMLMVASPALALAGTETLGDTNTLDVTTSTNVIMAYSGGTDGTAYIIGTTNSKGTKAYAATSGFTGIFVKDVAGDTGASTDLSDVSDDNVGAATLSDWNVLGD